MNKAIKYFIFIFIMIMPVFTMSVTFGLDFKQPSTDWVSDAVGDEEVIDGVSDAIGEDNLLTEGYNVVEMKLGDFKELENIDTRTLREDIYDQMIDLFTSNMGITDYWAKSFLDDYAGINLDTEDYAKAMTDSFSEKMPFVSSIPGFSDGFDTLGITDAINDMIAEYGDLFRDYDLTKESIHPLNSLEPSKIVYTIPVNENSPFKGEFVQGNLKYRLYEGDKDKVSVYITYETKDGEVIRVKDEEMLKTVYEKGSPKMTKDEYNNGRRAFDYGYEFLLKNVTFDKIKNINLVIDSGYNLPMQPSEFLAGKVADYALKVASESFSNSTVGKITGLLTPSFLTNLLNDNQQIVNSPALKNKLIEDHKEYFEKLGIDDQMCNMDYAELITEKGLKSIPYIGKVIDYIPNLDNKISDFVRLVLDQEDINSRMDVTNLNLTLTPIARENLPYNNTIGFDNRNIPNGVLDTAEDIFLPLTLHNGLYGLRKPSVFQPIDENNTNVFKVKFIDSGKYWIESAVKNTGPKSMVRNSYSEDFTLYANVNSSLNISETSEGSDMGLLFRVTDSWYCSDSKENISGYYAGLSVSRNIAFISKVVDNQWQTIKSVPMKVEDLVEYNLKIVTKGNDIKLYVNNFDKAVIEIKDDSYSAGFVGVRCSSEKGERTAVFDDILLQVEMSDSTASNSTLKKGEMLPFNIVASSYETNKEYEIDLDGNGSKEKIKVENKDYQKKITVSYMPTMLMNQRLLKPDEFWIIDIDANDSYKELVYYQFHRDNRDKAQYVVYSYMPRKTMGLRNIGTFDKIISLGNGWITGEKDGKILDMVFDEDHKLVQPTN